MKNFLLAMIMPTLMIAWEVSDTPITKTNQLAKSDSLPAGSKVSIQIDIPGDPIPTKFTYTVPTSAVKPADPKPVEPAKPVAIANQSGIVGQSFSFSIPDNVFASVVLNIDVSDLPPGLRYDSKSKTISGTPTAADTRTITVSGWTGSDVLRTTFTLTITQSGGGIPTLPPIRDDNQTTGTLFRNEVPFNYSEQPNVINRMQAPAIPAYRDGWRMKTSDIVVAGNNGITETPDELRKRGHNYFNALWFYGDEGPASWGLPKKEDNLFYEYTGNSWGPWHKDPYRSVVDDFSTIINTSLKQLPLWNTGPYNGLIEGVATVKLGHFNVEYDWFEQNVWNKLSADQRNVVYYNYAINRKESLQETFNRGGLEEIKRAQHQKWRNIIAASILYLDRNCNGMKSFYGDYHGLTSIKSLASWSLPISPTDYLTANVNDASLYPEANEIANAGLITVFNGQQFDVSGNFNLINKHRHCYSYEWEFYMTESDYLNYFSITKDASADKKDLRPWFDKFFPNVTRPYDIAYHVLSNWSIEQRKGWPHMPLEFQTEPIFEQLIRNKNTYAQLNGAWVPWTLHDTDNQKQTKVPVHPEISEYLTIYSRLHYDGKFMWGLGCCSRIDPASGKGDNVNPTVHQVAREAEQKALTELGQYNETVFLADKRQHIGDIPVLAPNGQYVVGDPSVLLKNKAALVTGVDSPSSGWELYTVYFPHADRYGETLVKFKSPVDGAELSAIAKGWSVRLYARKR